MNTLTREKAGVTAEKVAVTDKSLIVELSDGRVLSVPLSWYPRLLNGSHGERSHWRLIGRGIGVHWPYLDEDISIEGLLNGANSGESQASLAKWAASRRSAGVTVKRRAGRVLSHEYSEVTGVSRVAEKPAGYSSSKSKPASKKKTGLSRKTAIKSRES